MSATLDQWIAALLDGHPPPDPAPDAYVLESALTSKLEGALAPSQVTTPSLTAEAVSLDTIVYTPLSSPPPNPVEGETYYDQTLKKIRTWDSSAWHDHW